MFWLSDISKENLKSILFSFSNYMDKILIVKLVGGLGNQMFQYAAARAASCRTKIPFKLDITSLKMILKDLLSHPKGKLYNTVTIL